MAVRKKDLIIHIFITPAAVYSMALMMFMSQGIMPLGDKPVPHAWLGAREC